MAGGPGGRGRGCSPAPSSESPLMQGADSDPSTEAAVRPSRTANRMQPRLVARATASRRESWLHPSPDLSRLSSAQLSRRSEIQDRRRRKPRPAARAATASPASRPGSLTRRLPRDLTVPARAAALLGCWAVAAAAAAWPRRPRRGRCHGFGRSDRHRDRIRPASDGVRAHWHCQWHDAA